MRYIVNTGQDFLFVYVFVGGDHPADTTQRNLIASTVHTFEAVAGSWWFVSAPALSRVMGGAPWQSEIKIWTQ